MRQAIPATAHCGVKLCSPVPACTSPFGGQSSATQDLTQHREAVANCRRGFVASEGFVLVGADYCQIELRIMAHLSKDPALLKMFEGNADPFRCCLFACDPT